MYKLQLYLYMYMYIYKNVCNNLSPLLLIIIHALLILCHVILIPCTYIINTTIDFDLQREMHVISKYIKRDDNSKKIH